MKTGYKQTEVGVIPEDWEVKSIGEISVPVRGVRHVLLGVLDILMVHIFLGLRLQL